MGAPLFRAVPDAEAAGDTTPRGGAITVVPVIEANIGTDVLAIKPTKEFEVVKATRGTETVFFSREVMTQGSGI